LSKKIVILGTGTGGLVVANRLRKALSTEHEIVTVDQNKNHLFNPSLLWVMVGWRDGQKIQKPLILLEKKGIRFLNAVVEKIDFENKVLETSLGNENFDYLVIAPGANTYPERLSGFTEAAHNLYDLSGVGNIRNSITHFDRGRLVLLIASMPFKCPAAPYEAALLLSKLLQKNRSEVEIELITPEPLPMGVAGPEVGKMVVSMLQSQNISFTSQHQAMRINSEKKEIVFNDDKSTSYDFLVGVPPHGVPEFLQNSPLVGDSGWVKVNPKTLETELDQIYALGDVTGIPLSVGKPLPKAGVFAHFQAEVVAQRITSQIEGVIPEKEFDGHGYCFIELGDGRAGYASGNFYNEPKPLVNIKKPSKIWHWGKVLFEKWWLWKWF